MFPRPFRLPPSASFSPSQPHSLKTPKKTRPKIPRRSKNCSKLTPEEAIKRFDKNSDSKLSKDERSHGGPRQGVRRHRQEWRRQARSRWRSRNCKRCSATSSPMQKRPAQDGAGMDVEKIIDNLLKQFDTNGDGKISRAEAKVPFLADNFDRLDANKDGFLDRE